MNEQAHSAISNIITVIENNDLYCVFSSSSEEIYLSRATDGYRKIFLSDLLLSCSIINEVGRWRTYFSLTLFKNLLKIKLGIFEPLVDIYYFWNKFRKRIFVHECVVCTWAVDECYKSHEFQMYCTLYILYHYWN